MVEETYKRTEGRKQRGGKGEGRRTNGDLTIIKWWKRHIGGGRKGSRKERGEEGGVPMEI